MRNTMIAGGLLLAFGISFVHRGAAAAVDKKDKPPAPKTDKLKIRTVTLLIDGMT